MSSIFDGVAAALASLIGTSSEAAGFLLGFIVIIVLLVALTWVLGDTMQGYGFLIPAGIGIAMVVMVGWWPLWTLVFIALLVVLVIVKPFGSSAAA